MDGGVVGVKKQPALCVVNVQAAFLCPNRNPINNRVAPPARFVRILTP